MKQLIQNFKTGDLYVDDVPVPAATDRMVLVKNHYSLISAGTERGTVSVGKASLLGKAKKRPDLVKQVLQNIKKEGLKATYEKVRTKLDSLKALGYSTAGEVVASMDSNGYFKPGDRVACAGQDYASHAEVVSIPQNLVAKIPDGVSYEEAAFTTVGAIAMQGIRQAAPTLGERIAVIGLGLLGQITCQLLQANGCKVFGIDLSQQSVDLANTMQVATAVNRQNSDIETIAGNFTEGYGFDKVIITAATTSNDPIELSARLLRKKGAVIIVGDVKMEVPRNPDFYRNELELKMSCSYGPGRYDVQYEELGNDYPYGYVRWTEQRNMQAFLELIDKGVVKIKPLISFVFDIDEATKAYNLVLGKEQKPYVGILLKYRTLADEKLMNFVSLKPKAVRQINVAVVGAGSFAQSYLLPYIQPKASMDTVVTRNGMNAKNVAQKFGFATASTSAEDVFKNEDINTVFIASRHNTHAAYTIDALNAGKNVFVEKPLALNYNELMDIKKAYNQQKNSRLLVGFNRRFAAVSERAKQEFAGIGEPLVMNFRVNAGFIPKEHWTQTSEGGGRIIGEVCHFIDLMQFLTNTLPVSVFAQSLSHNNSSYQNVDNLLVNIRFSDGSIGNLTYTANGDKSMPKEYFEIFGGNKCFVINDFKGGVLHQNNRSEKISNSGKGHREEVTAFLDCLQKAKPSPITFESIFYTTLTTFKIIDSLITGLPQEITGTPPTNEPQTHENARDDK